MCLTRIIRNAILEEDLIVWKAFMAVRDKKGKEHLYTGFGSAKKNKMGNGWIVAKKYKNIKMKSSESYPAWFHFFNPKRTSKAKVKEFAERRLHQIIAGEVVNIKYKKCLIPAGSEVIYGAVFGWYVIVAKKFKIVSDLKM